MSGARDRTPQYERLPPRHAHMYSVWQDILDFPGQHPIRNFEPGVGRKQTVKALHTPRGDDRHLFKEPAADLTKMFRTVVPWGMGWVDGLVRAKRGAVEAGRAAWQRNIPAQLVDEPIVFCSFGEPGFAAGLQPSGRLPSNSIPPERASDDEEIPCRLQSRRSLSGNTLSGMSHVSVSIRSAISSLFAASRMSDPLLGAISTARTRAPNDAMIKVPIPSPLPRSSTRALDSLSANLST